MPRSCRAGCRHATGCASSVMTGNTLPTYNADAFQATSSRMVPQPLARRYGYWRYIPHRHQITGHPDRSACSPPNEKVHRGGLYHPTQLSGQDKDVADSATGGLGRNGSVGNYIILITATSGGINPYDR